MSDDEGDDIQYERPAKRFRHQSYKQSLKQIHVTPAFAQTPIEGDLGDNDSYFHEALEHWRELNLAPSFIKFANKANGLSASMPLLVHQWKDVVDLWLAAVDSADDEGLKALLDLFQKLAHDLRTTIAPSRSDVLSRLLKLLPRSLKAETLTALLETLSSFFKYVLIPSDTMDAVWMQFAEVLPKCNPEVQRVVAELWGNGLRRMKTDARERCVVTILNNANAEVAAWAFVTACKSVSQTLHTASPSIFLPALRSHLSLDNIDVSFVVIRRLLTALVHHCKSAEQFAPLGDILVKELTEAPKEDGETLHRLLDVVSVACSIRQGSRLTAKHHQALLAQFLLFPLTENLRPALLKFAVSCLTAGDMALWMATGRKVLERAWEESPSLALDMTGALSDLNWGGWKLLALPHVLKRTTKSLETHPRKTLEVLSALHKAKRLDSVDAAWKQSLQSWVDVRFQDWHDDQEQMFELHHVIQLESLLPTFGTTVVRIVDIAVKSEEPEAQYVEQESNSSWVLGSCLSCLATRKRSEWGSRSDLATWTEAIIRKWYWSGYVLEGLFTLMKSSGSTTETIAFDAAHSQLQASLLSHSRRLRLASLQFLQSQAAEGKSEVVDRCLSGEEVPVDVQGVRERVLRITRMNQILRDGDELGADIAIRWLNSQLKVNLRPLWKPAAEALTEISARFGEQVWQLLFAELRGASAPGADDSRPDWMMRTEDELDDVFEVEKTWRDPSAHKLRSAVTKWLRGDMARLGMVEAQYIPERFDPGAYEIQLLTTLSQCPALAEKHSKDLVPHFLSLAPPDSPTKLARHKLGAWLTLFAKFVNPKALRSTEDLQTIYATLLSHPDRPLQRLALSCTLTYKVPALVSRQDSLTTILDETRWRDELTQLNIADIPPDEREVVVDVIIRLLFGLMLERHGRSRGADRRAAALSTLGGCTDKELCLLVDLMLRPFSGGSEVAGSEGYQPTPVREGVSDKQLVGFVTLLGDVLKNLGSRLSDRWAVLFRTVLDVVAYAQNQIQVKTGSEGRQEHEPEEAHEEMQEAVPEEMQDEAQEAQEAQEHEGKVHEHEDEEEAHEEEAHATEAQDQEAAGEEDVDADGDDEDEDEKSGSQRALRTVRQLGLKRLADFFKTPLLFDYAPYLPWAFSSFISPRLPTLDVESTQAPTALLELFHVWSTEAHYARFLSVFDNRTLPKVYSCLVAKNVKPSVVGKVFDIVENLMSISAEDEDFRDTVFKPHADVLLGHLAVQLERSKGATSITDQLGRRQISILSQLAPFMTDSTQASSLLELLLPFLRRPSNLIPEKIKVDMLTIVKNLLPLVSNLSDVTATSNVRLHALLAYLFQNLRSRQARLGLVDAFHTFAGIDGSLTRITEVLESLNAYSTRRLEEPDFDRRLQAFALVNETLHGSLTTREWLPVLYNMLNFIQDPEELTIRTNASACIKRFLDVVAKAEGGDVEQLFVKSLWPGLRNGLRSKNEQVRAEILGVVSYAIGHCEHINALQEMRPLLAAGDEEANFFNNVLHIQVHRRTRALRRLADYCDEGKLRSSTLNEIFIPLLGNFITGDASVDHLLVNEAIHTTGRMAKHLQWGAYYSLVQQYLRSSKAKDASERVYIRTLVALLDNFHFTMGAVVDVVEPNGADDSPQALEEVASDALKATKISDAVNQKLLPALINHLEKREEAEESVRIPLAVGIVRVALHLPDAAKETQISRLLTVLAQVFRSKSQDVRDLTRDTLCKIAVTLGPSYLHHIVHELRTALLRGPHLHVLAYITHALLVHVTSDVHSATFTQLDDCVADVAHVASEVIFGESGKDVQTEGFRTKVKEVRSSTSKGLDCFAILAKHMTPAKISALLLPVRNILQQTETLRVMQQVEDVLRRIAGGLNSNQLLTPKDLLVLCHTLISQNAKFLKQVPKVAQRGRGKRDAVVELKRHMVEDADHYANNSFRFIAFGLELFNTAHKRSRFDFQDPTVIARLEPMVAVIGNTLYSTHMQVVIPGLKATAAIVHCPLQSIAKSLPVFIRRTIEIVKQTGSTESEVVQTAFKSLSTILRDQPSAQVKESDLVFLLELLTPDLEEPERQAAVFAMLRAIVARKFVVPEIYDLMDKVSEIMVTNQSPQVRELCRVVLLQFLLEYPQGKGRLRNHMTFFAKNLSYVHESGRVSVMELLSAVLAKFNPDLVREYSDMLFVALVMVVANDDSTKCREMASELIKGLFGRLDDAQRRVVMSHVHSWASQHGQPQLTRMASQIYSILIDHLQGDVLVYAEAVVGDVNAILANTREQLEAAEGDADMDIDVEWQVPYHALIALSKLLRACPSTTTEDGKVVWSNVIALLLFPHSWVRTASCRLLGLLYAAVPAAAPQVEAPEDLTFSSASLEDVAKKLCLQLRSENLDNALSVQIVKNLFYIGKCFSLAAEQDTEEVKDVDEEDEDETKDGGDDGDVRQRHPLSWLFSKLSYQARSAHIARRNKSSSPDNWYHQPASVLRWFAAMTSFLDASIVERYLNHMLSPMYRIVEDDTIRDPHMDELRTTAVELQELIQAKVGTTKFSEVYSQIRQHVVGVRRDRRSARAIQTTTNPEMAARHKYQRNVAKKDSRKRKNATFAENRGRIKRRKDE